MLTEQELSMELGPVLADGTRVSDLIDLDRREVSMRVLADPELYRLELEKLFTRAWLCLAHESEIPLPGDFVTRYMGEDPVIVSRDRHGAINVLLNVCQHRGMEVCRAEVGNATQFRCAYHGWVYDQRGAFLGAPVNKEQMWGDICKKSELGLPVARTQTYAGMIFATWDQQAPSLEEFLGDITWYVDMMYDRTDNGMEVVGPPQRYIIDANWKCAGEQFNADGYHTLTLHRSLIELAVIGDQELSREAAPSMYGVDVSANGHGIRCIPSAGHYAALVGDKAAGLSVREKLNLLPPPGMSADMIPQLERRFDEGQLRVLADTPPHVGGLFPNVGLLNVALPQPDGTRAGTASWHTFFPKGPGKFEFVNWVLVDRDASDELKERIQRASVGTFGTSGTVEQDDAETWPSMQRAARGAMGRRQTIKYQALLGERKPADWPGGGHVYEGFTKDDSQWQWWLRWLEYMIR